VDITYLLSQASSSKSNAIFVEQQTKLHPNKQTRLGGYRSSQKQDWLATKMQSMQWATPI